MHVHPYLSCTQPLSCSIRGDSSGADAHSGTSFEHRRAWIRDRLFQLADVFAIDVAGYAVMSNHYHLVLSVSRDEADAWSGDDVIERWHRCSPATR
jgi:hypothetical protein